MFEPTPNQFILNPYKFQESVAIFTDYFSLTRRNPGMLYLQEILDKYSQLPYENISKIIKLNQHWDSLDKLRLPAEVMAAHISQKLGGTCFSLTFFLQTILTAENFQCYPVMAHMRAGQNIHCALIVLLEGVKYLIDPGYLLNQPMAIEPLLARVYLREFGGVELKYDPPTGYYNLFTFDRELVKWRHQFQDRACPPDEFLQHWLASFTKPSMHGLCLTRVTKGGLIYIHKNFMRETSAQGKKNSKIKHNYHATIQQLFGINQEMIEIAQGALDENLARERATGIYVPRSTDPAR